MIISKIRASIKTSLTSLSSNNGKRSAAVQGSKHSSADNDIIDDDDRQEKQLNSSIGLASSSGFPLTKRTLSQSSLKTHHTPDFFSSPNSAEKDVSFEVDCEIEALTECPQKGYFFVKWKHLSSKKNGTSPLIEVQDHKALWKHRFQLEVSIPVHKETNVLEDNWLRFSVRREQTEGVVKIGNAKVNLSEFANTRASIEKKKTVKLLLQNAVVNSALSVSIGMKQVAGSPFFKCPMAKSSRLVSSSMHEDEIDTTTAALMLLKNIDNPKTAQLRRDSLSNSEDEGKADHHHQDKNTRAGCLVSNELFGLLGDSMAVDAVQDHLEKSPGYNPITNPASPSLFLLQSSPIISTSSATSSPRNGIKGILDSASDSKRSPKGPSRKSRDVLNSEEVFTKGRKKSRDVLNSEEVFSTGRKKTASNSVHDNLAEDGSTAYHMTSFELAHDLDTKSNSSNPSSSKKLEMLMILDQLVQEEVTSKR